MRGLLACFVFAFLAACGAPGPAGNTAGRTVEPLAPLILDWADLMPEGEIEILQQYYDDFYTELDRKMLLGQQTLADAARDGAYAQIPEGSALDEMPQFGTFRTVTELNGEYVRVPGFVVPLELASGGKVSEFLFVPYYGACIHYPPPPPNQILYVRADPAIPMPDMRQAFWAEGHLTTGEFFNELGDTAYQLALTRLDAY